MSRRRPILRSLVVLGLVAICVATGTFAAFSARTTSANNALAAGTVTLADNDAGGVATYSIAGAKLGYPILFLLPVISLLLALTQELGMRLTVVTRRGLAAMIRDLKAARAIAFDVETDGLSPVRAGLVGISLAVRERRASRGG